MPGLGFVVQHGKRIAAGGSSYTRYRPGIEIEEDTAEKVFAGQKFNLCLFFIKKQFYG